MIFPPVPFCVASLRAFVGFNSATEKSLMYPTILYPPAEIFFVFVSSFLLSVVSAGII